MIIIPHEPIYIKFSYTHTEQHTSIYNRDNMKLVQLALVANFVLDVLAFLLGFTGHPLFFEIITQRVGALLGCNATSSALSTGVCSTYLVAASLLILFLGIVRLYGGLYFHESGAFQLAILSYLAEIAWFSLGIAAGTLRLFPTNVQECLRPAGQLVDCDARTFGPAIFICSGTYYHPKEIVNIKLRLLQE